jgi:hypothetical protein
MPLFEFSIVASGLDREADDFEDRFFEAGCDDATIAHIRGSTILHFAREAVSLEDAIRSAMDCVRKAGAVVDRVEPDYLVSLTDIAERSGLTRAAISNYARGARAQGFPHAIACITSVSPLWNWPDVAKWLHRRGQVPEEVVKDAETIKSATDTLSAGRKSRRRRAGPR